MGTLPVLSTESVDKGGGNAGEREYVRAKVWDHVGDYPKHPRGHLRLAVTNHSWSFFTRIIRMLPPGFVAVSIREYTVYSIQYTVYKLQG